MEDKKIVSEIYNICHLLHLIIGLDVRFIDVCHASSFKFKQNKLPNMMEDVSKNVDTNISTILKEQTNEKFLYYADSFKLSHIAVGKWDNDVYQGAIICGPFLFDIPDEAFILSVIEKNKLPISSKLKLLDFYKSQTILDSERYTYIGHLMVNLLSKPFISGQIILFEDIIPKIKSDITVEAVEVQSDIVMRYRLQNELSIAVEKGLKEEALKINNVFKFNPSKRVPNNPLRAFKNLAYTFNTILRMAADKGGVHPVYLHNASDKFATLIEKTSSISELESLQIKMISEYCDLVNKFSTLGYSPKIRKAINYITLNFDSHLSLNDVATNIDVNPSHLSRQFKKETKLTITDFINRKRVEEAKLLISQKSYSITEISLMVGFENHNYFSSVFKKFTSLTPSEYLKKS
jgi:AraC-like DNA-binding protein